MCVSWNLVITKSWYFYLIMIQADVLERYYKGVVIGKIVFFGFWISI